MANKINKIKSLQIEMNKLKGFKGKIDNINGKLCVRSEYLNAQMDKKQE